MSGEFVAGSTRFRRHCSTRARRGDGARDVYGGNARQRFRWTTSGDGRGSGDDDDDDEGTTRGGSKRNIFNEDDDDIHEVECDADDARRKNGGDDDDAKNGTTTTTNDGFAADVDEDGRYRCGDER